MKWGWIRIGIFSVAFLVGLLLVGPVTRRFTSGAAARGRQDSPAYSQPTPGRTVCQNIASPHQPLPGTRRAYCKNACKSWRQLCQRLRKPARQTVFLRGVIFVGDRKSTRLNSSHVSESRM